MATKKKAQAAPLQRPAPSTADTVWFKNTQNGYVIGVRKGSESHRAVAKAVTADEIPERVWAPTTAPNGGKVTGHRFVSGAGPTWVAPRPEAPPVFDAGDDEPVADDEPAADEG